MTHWAIVSHLTYTAALCMSCNSYFKPGSQAAVVAVEKAKKALEVEKKRREAEERQRKEREVRHTSTCASEAWGPAVGS